MLGVPAASAATTALLFLLGLALVAVAGHLARRRLRPLRGVELLVAAGLALSLVGLPWIAWRFVEDLRYTTGLDAYDRASAGPIQAYLPGYLVDGARSRIPANGTWAAQAGPLSNSIPAAAFPPLVLVTLFPRVSAPPATAGWILTLGAQPGTVARVRQTSVLRPATAELPAVRLGRAAR